MRKKIGNKKPIPFQYVPKRIVKLFASGELNRDEVWVVSQFCYYHERDWLLHTVGTNFPRGYKVQSSGPITREPNLDSVMARPVGKVYDVLHAALVEGVSFQTLAIAYGMGGVKKTLHRSGKRLLRQMLEKFADHLDG